MKTTTVVWVLGTLIATASCQDNETGGKPGNGDASGNAGAGGNPDASGAGGSGGVVSTGGVSGAGGAGGAGGQGGVAPPNRCDYASGGGGALSGPTVSEAVALRRVFQFLNGASTIPPGIPASQTTPATPSWAATIAAGILDDHLAKGTEAPGLVRFLSAWLKLPTSPSANLAPARTWSKKLLEPNATLTTLFTGPTSDPRRNGIFTDRQVLSVRTTLTSRGKWFAENVFCTPPIAASPPGLPALPAPAPGTTRRERLAKSLALSPACMGCHTVTDPPGFSLEHFDELGAYSDLDSGKAVDSSGTLLPPLPALSFTSIEDLAPQLATSCVVASCFTNAMMTDAFGAASDMSTALAFIKQEHDQVATTFANSNFSIRELVKAIVSTGSFLR